jgi:thiamine biosynthesis lipoprotein
MHRRDFLHPRRLAKTAADVLGAVQDQPRPRKVAPEIALLRFARQAMATTFEVFLPFGMPDALEIASNALDEINRLEDQLTVYHDHSEVSRLNRLAFQAAQPVEGRLFALLRRAAELHRQSDGAFDITTGALTRAWGFYRRRGQLPTPEQLREARERVGMQNVVLDADRQSVRYLRPGLEINLGSIGKGYALDRAATILRQQHGITAGLLHGGSSSIFAIGGPAAGHGWAVGVRHPWTRARLAILHIRDRAVGTSAATHQHFDYNGRKLGHILDPRTGWPAEGIASATAIASTAADADALATAFFIRGMEFTRAYCAAHPDTSAVLLADGADRPIIFGLAPDEIELLPAGPEPSLSDHS